MIIMHRATMQHLLFFLGPRQRPIAMCLPCSYPSVITPWVPGCSKSLEQTSQYLSLCIWIARLVHPNATCCMSSLLFPPQRGHRSATFPFACHLHWLRPCPMWSQVSNKPTVATSSFLLKKEGIVLRKWNLVTYQPVIHAHACSDNYI